MPRSQSHVWNTVSHRHGSTFAAGPPTGAVDRVGDLGLPDRQPAPLRSGSFVVDQVNGPDGHALVNQFGAYRKGVGFAKGLGSHAFRHTLATELDAKDVLIEHIALITGRSLNKKAPVLQENYIHQSASNVHKIQFEALEQYQPPVELPRYVRGQFRERRGKDARLYP